MRRVTQTPLTRTTVTAASRETVPAYAVGSASFGAALIGTLIRDRGVDGHWPSALRFLNGHLAPLWLIGVVFLTLAACMAVAMIQGDRWAYMLSLGAFIFWLILLGAFLAVSAVSGSGTYLAPLPFLLIAYLCRVTQKSLGREET